MHKVTRSLLLAALTLMASPLATAQSGTANLDEYRGWIEAMKNSQRGPFSGIRWFCSDGTVLPPRPYACNDHGGGHQHGQWSEQTLELREQGYLVATLMAGVNPETFLDSPEAANALAQLLIERYLISADEGWIMRQALFYRGAIQEEDEREGARRLLETMASRDEWIGPRFTELRVAVRMLPHGEDTASAQKMRQLSAALSDRDWLARGIHVITPNKRAGTAPMESYRELRKARRAGNTRFLYETTVGAGLPIIRTLQDLIQTGDKVESLEGIFSGTLAYLFNLYDGSVPFSSLVQKAREQGYTEPDPRDDLSGMDVARKLVILGREMGLDLELSDIKVESMVPEDLVEADVDTFLSRLTEFDEIIARRLEQARNEGKVLRYIARLDASGKATVGLVAVGDEHAFHRIDLTDNIVKFSSQRYADNPLIVRGPGAGADVTAAGIFADLLRLTGYLGAAL